MSSIAGSGDFRFSDGVIRGMVNGDVVVTGCELLAMKAGLRALPVDPERKKPFGWLTPNGSKDATDDPAILQQWMAVSGAHEGQAALAITPGPRFVIADDDTGTLDIGRFGPQDTFTEQTRRGLHSWFRLPDGRTLRKSRLPDGAGDIITGRGLALMSPSPRYRPVDILALVRMLPDDSPLWTIAAPVSTSGASSLTVTPEDEAEGQRITGRLLLSTDYGLKLKLLLAGKWEEAGYKSRSEADAALAFMASHFLRDNSRRAEILTAILHRYSLKAVSHATPDKYIQYVVSAVTRKRDTQDTARIRTLDTNIQTSLSHIPPTALRGDVTDGTLGKGRSVEASIWAIATGIDADLFWNAAAVRGGNQVRELIAQGWRRVPVSDLAAMHGVARRTVTRALEDMERRGDIERWPLPYRHDGRVRKDSLVRAVAS